MEDLKIKLKVEQMIQYGYSALRQFPKSERHVLSAEIRESMYRLLRLVIIGNRRQRRLYALRGLDSAS